MSTISIQVLAACERGQHGSCYGWLETDAEQGLGVRCGCHCHLTAGWKFDLHQNAESAALRRYVERAIENADIRMEVSAGRDDFIIQPGGFTIDKRRYRLRLADETEHTVKVWIDPICPNCKGAVPVPHSYDPTSGRCQPLP